MPPFSASALRPGCAGPRPRPRRGSRWTCEALEASSTRQSCQSSKVWRADRLEHPPEDAGRRFEDRRDDREAGRHCGRLAAAAREQPHEEADQKTGAGDRDLVGEAGDPLELSSIICSWPRKAPSSASRPISRSRSRRISSSRCSISRRSSSRSERRRCVEARSIGSVHLGAVYGALELSAIRGASRLKIQAPKTQTPTKIAAAGSRPSQPPAASTAVGASGSAGPRPGPARRSPPAG